MSPERNCRLDMRISRIERSDGEARAIATDRVRWAFSSSPFVISCSVHWSHRSTGVCLTTSGFSNAGQTEARSRSRATLSGSGLWDGSAFMARFHAFRLLPMLLDRFHSERYAQRAPGAQPFRQRYEPRCRWAGHEAMTTQILGRTTPPKCPYFIAHRVLQPVIEAGHQHQPPRPKPQPERPMVALPNNTVHSTENGVTSNKNRSEERLPYRLSKGIPRRTAQRALNTK